MRIAAIVTLACLLCVSCSGRQGNAGAHVTPPGAASAIEIRSARYGRDRTWVDVTPQLRHLVHDGRLILPRNLHQTLDVDPVPDRMKYVDLELVINGAEVKMIVADSLHLTPLQLTAGSPTTRPSRPD